MDIEPAGILLFGFMAFCVIAGVINIISRSTKRIKKSRASVIKDQVIIYDYETIRNCMTCKTIATIISREMVEKNDPKRHVSKQYEGSRYVEYIEYEYIVNGCKYHSYGVSSGAIWHRKSVPVYYDPNRPDNSVTKYIHDKATGKDFLYVLIKFPIILAIIVLVFYAIIKFVS